MPRLIAALATACLLAATPALAAEKSPDKPVDPWLAAALGPASAVALAATGGLLQYSPILYLSPLTIGAGHFYAGDPFKGAMYTAGSPFALAATVLAGSAVYNLSGGETPKFLFRDAAMFAVGAVPLLSYYGWVGWDAYNTALAKNAAKPH